MDNCKSEPWKNLKNEDFPVLIEYLDATYWWINHSSWSSLDKIYNCIKENPSFHDWLKKYIFLDKYNLYVGKFSRKDDKDADDVPEYGQSIQEKKQKARNWTTKISAATYFAKFNDQNTDKFLGGWVSKCLYNPIEKENIYCDCFRIYNFFATDDMYGAAAYDDFQKLILIHQLGNKLDMALYRLFNQGSMIKDEMEIVTDGSIDSYKVISVWSVDEAGEVKTEGNFE